LLTQGFTGDCYLISTLDQIITQAPFILTKKFLFYTEEPPNNIFLLNIDGERIPIPISKELPAYYQDIWSYYYAYFNDQTNPMP
jgi:hypothetical protein